MEVKKDINLLIDEKIFGFDISEVKFLPEPCTDASSPYLSCAVMHYGLYYPNGVRCLSYTSDITAATKLAVKMVELGYELKVKNYLTETNQYEVYFLKGKYPVYEICSWEVAEFPKAVAVAAINAFLRKDYKEYLDA